jgi:hypothetical protein
MKKNKGNLFLPHKNVDVVCISTNGSVDYIGNAIMERVNIKYSSISFYRIEKILGNKIKEYGNNVFNLGKYTFQNNNSCFIFSFPIKNNWWEEIDIKLINKSLIELNNIVNVLSFKIIWLPLIENNKLTWKNTFELMASKMLDDRFHIVSYLY